VLSVGACFVLLFEGYVICNISDQFGMVTEFKIITTLGYVGILSVIITGKVVTGFSSFVKFLCWTLALWLFIIWLYFHIRRFAVTQIDDGLQEFELYHVLRNKESFDHFRTFLQNNFCAENLEFFLDIYTLRKTLAVDPYIALSEEGSEVIKSCARVSLP